MTRKRPPKVLWACMLDGTWLSDAERKRRKRGIRSDDPYPECKDCPGPVKYERKDSE